MERLQRDNKDGKGLKKYLSLFTSKFDEMENKAIKIRVKGRVQGVFFRANTREKAQGLGLTGWVRNEPDGDVSIYAQGAEKNLLQLLDWSKRGPNFSRVEEISFEWMDNKEELDSFEIRY